MGRSYIYIYIYILSLFFFKTTKKLNKIIIKIKKQSSAFAHRFQLIRDGIKEGCGAVEKQMSRVDLCIRIGFICIKGMCSVFVYRFEYRFEFEQEITKYASSGRAADNGHINV